MPDLEFGCLPTIIGSMPHTDPDRACKLVARYLKDLPAWPQLPQRSNLEDMIVQSSEGFPGAVLEGRNVRVDRSGHFDRALEKLYTAYLENDIDEYPISPDYAAGLHRFLAMDNLSPRAVKGQIPGPVTWAGTVLDSSKKAIIHDEVLTDAAVKLLRLKAAWQEKALGKLSRNVIIFLDEPYLSVAGASTASGILSSASGIKGLLEEVLGGIAGIRGIHCCGNTDWSVLLSTSIHILSFDTYSYGESLSLYPSEVKRFLDRKAAIAWGIVPTNEEAIARETVASLRDRLEAAIAPFTRKGIRFEQLLRQGLLTPSCGLSGVSEDASERALGLLAELSSEMRQRYL